MEVIMESGRNDPCPCGSGKKYKKCCWDAHQEKRRQEEKLPSHLRPDPDDGWAGLFQPRAPGSARRDPPPPPDPALEAEADRLEKALGEADGAAGKMALLQEFLQKHDPLPACFDELVIEELRDLLSPDPADGTPPATLIEASCALARDFPAVFGKGGTNVFLNLYWWAETAGRADLTAILSGFVAADPARDFETTFQFAEFLLLTGRREPLADLVRRITPRLRLILDLEVQTRLMGLFSSVTLGDVLEHPLSAEDRRRVLDAWHADVGMKMQPQEFADAEEGVGKILGAPVVWNPAAGSAAAPDQAVGEQSWSFLRHLHDTVGVPWSAADFLRGQATDFLLFRLSESRVVKNVYRPDHDALKRFLEARCRARSEPSLPRWLGALTGVSLLADFLHEHGVLTPGDRDAWKAVCRELKRETMGEHHRFNAWLAALARFPLYGPLPPQPPGPDRHDVGRVSPLPPRRGPRNASIAHRKEAIRVGARVRVKDGMFDPDNHRFPIGGFTGTVFDVDDGDPEGAVGLRLDAATLARIPAEQRKAALDQDRQLDVMYLSAEALEVLGRPDHPGS